MKTGQTYKHTFF